MLAFIRVFSASKELLTELNTLTKEDRKTKLHTFDKLEISDNKAFEFLQKRYVTCIILKCYIQWYNTGVNYYLWCIKGVLRRMLNCWNLLQV